MLSVSFNKTFPSFLPSFQFCIYSGLDVIKLRFLNVYITHVFVCFSGSDLVDWLFTHVDGFTDRRDARKYACNLLKVGYIRHTVNKLTFSEQCYYVFGDLGGNGKKYLKIACLLQQVFFVLLPSPLR